VSGSKIERGATFPLGSTVQRGGVNFSVCSRNAPLLELLLFDSENAIRPARVIPLNPSEHRTYHYWHDWEGDQPLRRPFVHTVIYELHLRGFTRHPSSGVKPDKAGTYAGLIEKIPYLVDLGITAIELMPVFQFDASDAPAGHVNYWGYSPISFFAPHRAYGSRRDALGLLDEFRSLHRAGIEVILDVVFNHTAEGGQHGPTFCFRGLENGTYYLLESDRSRYADYTGTGNTLNANHPIVRRMILDSLHHWVADMHVDGFRFDLASVLSRYESGTPVPNPPVLWDIESDPALAGSKIIAEAWDAAGLYQVGSFVGDIVGRSGTGAFAMMSAASSKGTAIAYPTSRRVCWAVPIYTGRRHASLNRASTS
jgi:pullulanase/glycogen debranching enzyme